MEGRDKLDDQRKTVFRDQLITIGDLENFKTNLLQEIKDLLQESSPTSVKKWLKSSEVKKLLGISTGTLQNLRVNGTLSYSKVGGIIFYDYADIVKLIERNGRG